MSPEVHVAIGFFAIAVVVFGWARFAMWRFERAEEREAYARIVADRERDDDEFWNPNSDAPLRDWLVSLRFAEELAALPETEDVDR